MPRGIKGSGKPRNTQSRRLKAASLQIEDIDKQIQDYKEKIAELQNSKRELAAARNKEDAEQLFKAVVDSGLTVERALDVIRNSKGV
jgi:hypothetical protein